MSTYDPKALYQQASEVVSRAEALQRRAQATRGAVREVMLQSEAKRRVRRGWWHEWPALRPEKGGVLVMCMHCQAVKASAHRWAPPGCGSLLRGLGPGLVSHGICEDCIHTVYGDP